MNFLTFIGDLRMQYMKDQKIGNRRFMYYEKILFELEEKKYIQILCIKNNYTFLGLLSKNDIKIVMTDFDIINMLIFLLKNYNEFGIRILNNLKEYLNDNTFEYNYIIKTKTFRGKGIPIFNMTDLLLTKEDQEISLEEFLVMLNMIIEKERVSKAGNDKNTIAKYITFINVYLYDDKKYKTILINSDYNFMRDINKLSSQINFSGKNKKIIKYSDIRQLLWYNV